MRRKRIHRRRSPDFGQLNSTYVNGDEGRMLIQMGNFDSGASSIMGISMVKNESDVIEVFVRHNLRFLDALVILDNGSTDGTGEILDELITEGLPVVKMFAPRNAFNQDKRITNLMRTVSLLFSPAAIIPLDADEFIVCASRDEFLASILSTDETALGFVPFISYVPTQSDPSHQNVLRRILQRRKREDHQWYKIIIRRKLHSNPITMVETGNHDIKCPQPSQEHRFNNISLAHFPVRSSDQIQKKIIVNWLSVLAMGGHAHGMAWHWEKYYNDFKKNNYTQVDLADIANHYAAIVPSDLIRSPIDSFDFSLDLTAKFANSSPIKAVVDFAEQLVENQGQPIAITDQNKAWAKEANSLDIYADYPPFEYLFKLLRPHSVLEIGAFHGLHLQRLKDMGVQHVQGIEDIEIQKAHYQNIPFLKSDLKQPLKLSEKFDLVICLEVIDRLPGSFDSILVDSMVNHATRAILFSAARPDQPGIGHLNCQSVNYWIEHFEKGGWVPLIFQTLAFRTCASVSWFRANPILFVPKDSKDQFQPLNFSISDLERQDKIRWNWNMQNAGYYNYPHLGDELATSWH